MEPVEIDINLRQNVSEEADKASKGVSGIGDASSKATRELEAQVQRQLTVLAKLNKSLDDLEKRTSGKNTVSSIDATQVDATMQRIGNLRQMIDETRGELVAMRVDVEKINAVVGSMVQQYQTVEVAIKKMNDAGRGGSPAMESMKEDQRVLSDALGATGEQAQETFAQLSGLGMTTKDQYDQARKAVKQQADEVRNLKTDITSMENAYKDMAPGKQKNALGQEIEVARKQYAGAVVDLDRMKIKQDELQISSRRLTEQMEGLRDKMIKLRLEGKGNTDEYRKLEDLYKRLAAESAAVKFGGQDNSKVQGLVQGVTGLSGALTAGVGVMGLINGKSEEMDKIQARLQSMIAITIGLQEANNLVNRQGAFQTQIVAKATAAYSSAVTYLNTQLGISTVLSKTLIASGIGAIIAAVGLAVMAYSEWNKKQKEATALQDMQTKVSSEAQKNIQEQVTHVQSLERVLKDSNAQSVDRRDALLELKGIMPGYNAMLNSEGHLIEDNTGALDRYIQKIKSAARAKIAADNAVKAEQKMTDWIDSLNKDDQELLVMGDMGMLSKERMFAYTVLSNQRETLQSEIDKWNKVLDNSQQDGTETIVKGTKAYWLQVQKNAQASIDAMTDTQKGSRAWKKAVDEYNQATSKLKTFDIKGTTKSEETLAEKQAKAQETLSKMSIDYDSKIEAASAAAVKTGRANRLADAKADFEKQKNQLEKDLLSIADLEKTTGKPATEQRTKNKELGDASLEQYTAKTTTINEAADRALTDIMRNVDAAFKGELDKNIDAINAYYDDIILKATEEGATEDQLNRLGLSRTKEVERSRRDQRLKTIDFEEEVARREMELTDKKYFFAADRQADLVTIQRDAAAKRVESLRQEYAATPTPELKQDIKLAEIALEEFNTTLDDLQTSKLEEIASLAQSISKLGQSLSKSGGTIGEIGGMLSGVASSADDILTSFKKDATTIDVINAGISGMSTLYSMIADQTAANKEEQDKWTDAIYESEHAARMAKIASEAYQQRNMFDVENPYAKAVASMKQYTTAMGLLNEAAVGLEGGQVQVGTTKVVSGKNIATGAGAGAAVGAAVGSVIPVVGTLVGGLIGGLIGAGVGALTKKTVPVFESLSKKYGQIFDEKTYALNPKIVDDYSKLDESTRKLVDNWKEIQSAALEAQKQMEETLTALSGDIGKQLSDSLVEAFRNGNIYDAVDSFHDKITSTIEDIIAQLVFVAAFGDIFDSLGERFKASFGVGGDQSIVDDMMWFDKIYRGRLDLYNQMMGDAKDAGKQQGWDFFAATTATRTGTAGAYSSASQESITELTGNALALRTAVADIRNMQREELEIQQAAFALFVRIAENTEYCRYLEDMAAKLDGLNASFEDMKIRGLKVK